MSKKIFAKSNIRSSAQSLAKQKHIAGRSILLKGCACVYYNMRFNEKYFENDRHDNIPL